MGLTFQYHHNQLQNIKMETGTGNYSLCDIGSFAEIHANVFSLVPFESIHTFHIYGTKIEITHVIFRLIPHHKYYEWESFSITLNSITKWFNTCFTNFMCTHCLSCCLIYPKYAWYACFTKSVIFLLSFTTVYLSNITENLRIYTLFSQNTHFRGEKCLYIYSNEVTS